MQTPHTETQGGEPDGPSQDPEEPQDPEGPKRPAAPLLHEAKYIPSAASSLAPFTR